jgi:CubicO group peptidase (beta-lactamase class C family)
MSAPDHARFAHLYLNNGNWNGKQLVPADWVGDSTQPYSRSQSGRGYGYLWWTWAPADFSRPDAGLPNGTYFAWGAGGQYAFVIPADDLVVVSRVARSCQ